MNKGELKLKELLDFVDGQERSGLYDCRNLATDSLRAWVQLVQDRIAAFYRFMHADDIGDCEKCSEDLDWSCPYCGDPDGCNNMEAREFVRTFGRLEDYGRRKDWRGR